MGKFSHPQNDILMIVNTLAKTLSTPKEQDIEMPPVHEKGQKCVWEVRTAGSWSFLGGLPDNHPVLLGKEHGMEKREQYAEAAKIRKGRKIIQNRESVHPAEQISGSIAPVCPP